MLKSRSTLSKPLFEPDHNLQLNDRLYLVAEAVGDVALALIFYYNETYQNITKPELLEYFNSKVSNSNLQSFDTLVTEAWKFKIDISLTISEEDFWQRSKLFFSTVQDILGM